MFVCVTLLFVRQKGDTMLTEKEEKNLKLQEALFFCRGTENYYKNKHITFEYTDGVKIFCEKAEAYWLLDLVNSFVKTKPDLNDDLIGILLTVRENNTAKITFKKNTKILYKQEIPFTDCPIGKWKFFYQEGVLFWHDEY